MNADVDDVLLPGRQSELEALAEPIARDGDRILVVYGLGHPPILKHLVESSARFELADTSEVLASPP